MSSFHSKVVFSPVVCTFLYQNIGRTPFVCRAIEPKTSTHNVAVLKPSGYVYLVLGGAAKFFQIKFTLTYLRPSAFIDEKIFSSKTLPALVVSQT